MDQFCLQLSVSAAGLESNNSNNYRLFLSDFNIKNSDYSKALNRLFLLYRMHTNSVVIHSG